MADDDTTTGMVDQTETETVTDDDTASEPTVTDLQAEMAEMRKALRAANREAAERRKKLEAYEQAETERKQAEMTELEKAQAARQEAERRAEEAESKLAFSIRRDAFYGWASPTAREDAITLLDLEGDADVAEMVAELQEKRPYLFKQEPSPEVPDIDGRPRGRRSKAEADEDRVKEAARKYGTLYVPRSNN